MKICVVLLCLQSALALRRLQPGKGDAVELPDEDWKSDDVLEFSEEEMKSFEKESSDGLEALQNFEPSESLVAAWKAEFENRQASRNKEFYKSDLNAMTLPAVCKNEIRRHQFKNAQCVDPWSKTSICKNSYEIPEYRLGDMFLENYKVAETNSYMKHYFPDSIAERYLKTKKGRRDMDALIKVIDGPAYQAFEKPTPNEMVVHLRLGDVTWTKGDDTYRDAARNAQKHGMNSVVLVTGEHMFKQQAELGLHSQGDENKYKQNLLSKVKHVESIFQEHGLNVKKRINYNADCDFIYMVNAPIFVPSGGSFSSLMHQVWKKKQQLKNSQSS